MAQLSDLRRSIVDMSDEEATRLVLTRRDERQRSKKPPASKVKITKIEANIGKMDDSQLDVLIEALAKTEAGRKVMQQTGSVGSDGLR